MPKNVENPVDLTSPSSEIFEFSFAGASNQGASRKFVFLSSKTQEGKSLWEVGQEKTGTASKLRDQCFYSLAKTLEQKTSLNEHVVVEVKGIRKKSTSQPQAQPAAFHLTLEQVNSLEVLRTHIEEELERKSFIPEEREKLKARLLEINQELAKIKEETEKKLQQPDPNEYKELGRIKKRLEEIETERLKKAVEKDLELCFTDPNPYQTEFPTFSIYNEKQKIYLFSPPYESYKPSCYFLDSFSKSDYRVDLDLLRIQVKDFNFLLYQFGSLCRAQSISEKREIIENQIRVFQNRLAQLNPEEERKLEKKIQEELAEYNKLKKDGQDNLAKLHKERLLNYVRWQSKDYLNGIINIGKSLLSYLDHYQTEDEIKKRKEELENLDKYIDETTKEKQDYAKSKQNLLINFIHSLGCLGCHLDRKDLQKFLLKEIARQAVEIVKTHLNDLPSQGTKKNSKTFEETFSPIVQQQVLAAFFDHFKDKLTPLFRLAPTFDKFWKLKDNGIEALKPFLLTLSERAISSARQSKALEELNKYEDVEESDEKSVYVYDYAILEGSKEDIADVGSLEVTEEGGVSQLAYVVQECTQPILQTHASSFQITVDALTYLIKSVFQLLKSALFAVYELASGTYVTSSIETKDLQMPYTEGHQPFKSTDYRSFLAHLDVTCGLFSHYNDLYPGVPGSFTPVKEQKKPESQVLFQSYASQMSYLLQEGKEIGEMLLQAQDSGTDKKALKRLNTQLEAKFNALIEGKQSALLIPVADGEGVSFAPQFLIFLIDPRSTPNQKSFLLKHIHLAPLQSNNNQLPSVTTYDATPLLTNYSEARKLSKNDNSPITQNNNGQVDSKKKKKEQSVLENLMKALITLLPQKGRQETDLKLLNQSFTFIQSYLTSLGLEVLNPDETIEQPGSCDSLETLFLLLKQLPKKHFTQQIDVLNKPGKVSSKFDIFERTPLASELHEADPLFRLTTSKGAFYQAYAEQLIRIFEAQKWKISEAHQLHILQTVKWYIEKAETQLQKECGNEGASIIIQNLREYAEKKIACFKNTQEAEKKDLERLNQPADLLTSKVVASFSASSVATELSAKNVKVETLPPDIEAEFKELKRLLQTPDSHAFVYEKLQELILRIQSLIKENKKETARLLAIQLIRLLPPPSSKLDCFWSRFDLIGDENQARESKQWQELLYSLAEITWKATTLSGAFPLPTHEAIELEVVLPLIQRRLYMPLANYYVQVEEKILSGSAQHREALKKATDDYLKLREEELKEKTLIELRKKWKEKDKEEYAKVDKHPTVLLRHEQEKANYASQLTRYQRHLEFISKLQSLESQLIKEKVLPPFSFNTEESDKSAYEKFKREVIAACQKCKKTPPPFPDFVSFRPYPQNLLDSYEEAKQKYEKDLKLHEEFVSQINDLQHNLIIEQQITLPYLFDADKNDPKEYAQFQKEVKVACQKAQKTAPSFPFFVPVNRKFLERSLENFQAAHKKYDFHLKLHNEYVEFAKKMGEFETYLIQETITPYSFDIEGNQEAYVEFQDKISAACGKVKSPLPAFPSFVPSTGKPLEPNQPQDPLYLHQADIEEVKKTRLGKELHDAVEEAKKTDDFYVHLTKINHPDQPLYLDLHKNRQVILHASTKIVEGESPNLWVHALWGRYCQILGIDKETLGYGFFAKQLALPEGKRPRTLQSFFLINDASLLIGSTAAQQERWNTCKEYYQSKSSVVQNRTFFLFDNLPFALSGKENEKMAYVILGYEKTHCYQKPHASLINEFPAHHFLFTIAEKTPLLKDGMLSIISLTTKAHRGALPEKEALFYGVPPQTIALCRTEAMIEMLQRPYGGKLSHAPGIFRRFLSKGSDLLLNDWKKTFQELASTSPLHKSELNSLRNYFSKQKDLYLVEGPGDCYYLLPTNNTSYKESTYCVYIPSEQLPSTNTTQRADYLGDTSPKSIDALITIGGNIKQERTEKEIFIKKSKNSGEEAFKQYLLRTLNLSEFNQSKVAKLPDYAQYLATLQPDINPYERSSITVSNCLQAIYQLPHQLENADFWHDLYNSLFQRDLALKLLQENPPLFVFLGSTLTKMIPYIREIALENEQEKFEAILFIHEIAGRFHTYLNFLQKEIESVYPGLPAKISAALPSYTAEDMVKPFNDQAGTSQQKVTAFYALLYITKNASYLYSSEEIHEDQIPAFDPSHVNTFLKAYAVYLQSPALFKPHPQLHHELLSTIRLTFLPAIDTWLEQTLQKTPTVANEFLTTLTGQSSSTSVTWVKQTSYVYVLGDFVLDLSNGMGVHIERHSLFARSLIPLRIQQSKEYCMLFGEKEMLADSTTEEIQGATVFSFTDEVGTEFEIIDNQRKNTVEFIQKWEGKRYRFQRFALDLSLWEELLPKGERSHALHNFLAENGSWIGINEHGKADTSKIFIPQVSYRLEDAYGATIKNDRLTEAFIGSGPNKKWVCFGLKNDIEPLLPCCNVHDLILLTRDKSHIDEIRFPNGLILYRSPQDPQCWKVFGRKDWEWHLTDTSILVRQFGKQYREFLLPLINRQTHEQEFLLFPHLFEAVTPDQLRFFSKPGSFYKNMIEGILNLVKSDLLEKITNNVISNNKNLTDEIVDLIQSYQPVLNFLLEYLQERKFLVSKTHKKEKSEEGSGEDSFFGIKESLLTNLDKIFEGFENELTKLTDSNQAFLNPLFLEQPLPTTISVSHKYEQGSYTGYLYLAFVAFNQGDWGTASHYLGRMTSHGKLYLDHDHEQMKKKATREEIKQHKKEMEERALRYFLRTVEFVFSFSSFLEDLVKTPSSFLFSPIFSKAKPEQIAFHIKLAAALKKIHPALKAQFELPLLHSLFYEGKHPLLDLYDALPSPEKEHLKRKGLGITPEECRLLQSPSTIPFSLPSDLKLYKTPQSLSFKVPTEGDVKKFIEAYPLYNLSSSSIPAIHRRFGAAPKLETVVAHFWDYWQWIINNNLSAQELAFLMQPTEGIKASIVDTARCLLLSLYHLNKHLLDCSEETKNIEIKAFNEAALQDFFITAHNLFRDIQRYRKGVAPYGEQLIKDQKFSQEIQQPRSFSRKALRTLYHYGKKLLGTSLYYFETVPDKRKKGGISYKSGTIDSLQQQMRTLLIDHFLHKLPSKPDAVLTLDINLVPLVEKEAKQKSKISTASSIQNATQPSSPVVQKAADPRLPATSASGSLENFKQLVVNFILDKVENLEIPEDKKGNFITGMVLGAVKTKVQTLVPSLVDQIPKLIEDNKNDSFKDVLEKCKASFETLYDTISNDPQADYLRTYLPDLIPNIKPWINEFFISYEKDLRQIYNECRLQSSQGNVNSNSSNSIIAQPSNVNPPVDLSSKPKEQFLPFSIYKDSISLEEAQKSALPKGAWEKYFQSVQENEAQLTSSSRRENIWEKHQKGWEEVLKPEAINVAPLSLGKRFGETILDALPEEQRKLSEQTDRSLNVTSLKALLKQLEERKKVLKGEIQERGEALLVFCRRYASSLDMQSQFADGNFPPQRILDELFYRLSRGKIQNLSKTLGKELSEKAVAYMLVATEIQQIEKALHVRATMWKQLEEIFRQLPTAFANSSRDVVAKAVQELADRNKDWLDRSLDLYRHLEGSNRLRYCLSESTESPILANTSLSLKYLYEDYSQHQITRLEAKASLESLLGDYIKDDQLSEEDKKLLKQAEDQINNALIKGKRAVKVQMGTGKSTFIFPMIARRMWEKGVFPVMMTTPGLLHQFASFMQEKCFEFHFDIDFGMRIVSHETKNPADLHRAIMTHLWHLKEALHNQVANRITILTTLSSLGSLRDKRAEVQDRFSRAPTDSPEEKEAFEMLTLLQEIECFFKEKNVIHFHDEDLNDISQEYNFATGEQRTANPFCISITHEFIQQMLRHPQLHDALFSDQLRAMAYPEKELGNVVEALLNNTSLWVEKFHWKKEAWEALDKKELLSYLKGETTEKPACLLPLQEFSYEKTPDQKIVGELFLQAVKDPGLLANLKMHIARVRYSPSSKFPVDKDLEHLIFSHRDSKKLALTAQEKEAVTFQGVLFALAHATSFEKLLEKKPSRCQMIEKKYPHLCYLEGLKMVFDSLKKGVYKVHPKMERGINQANGCSVVPYSDGNEKPMTIYGNEVEFILHHYLHYVTEVKDHVSNKAFEIFFFKKKKEIEQGQSRRKNEGKNNQNIGKEGHQIPGSTRLWSDWLTDISDFKISYVGEKKLSSFEAFIHNDPKMVNCRLEFIRYLLEAQDELKVYAEQIECNSQDVDANIFPQVQMASGTGDSFALNLLSPNDEHIVEKNSITAAVLLCLDPHEKIGSENIFENPLEYILKIANDRNCHAIMNKGYDVLNNQTEHLAALLHKEGEKERLAGRKNSVLATRQLLFSHSITGEKKIWNPEANTPIAYETNLVIPDQALALFGPAQCRGLDFLLPRDKDIFGVVMVDLNSTEEEVIQALGRQRQLGKGQKGKLAIDQKMAARVCFLNNLTNPDEITIAHVFRAILKRTELEQKIRHKKAVQFDIQTVRRNALDHILIQPYKGNDPQELKIYQAWTKRLFTILRTLYYRNNEILWSDQVTKLARFDFLKQIYENELQEVERVREDLCAIWIDYTHFHPDKKNLGIQHHPLIAPVVQALNTIESTLKKRVEALKETRVQQFYEYYLEDDSYEISNADQGAQQEQLVQQHTHHQVQQQVERFVFTEYQYKPEMVTFPPLSFHHFIALALLADKEKALLDQNNKGGTNNEFAIYYSTPLGHFKPLMAESFESLGLDKDYQALPHHPFLQPLFKNQFASERALQHLEKGKGRPDLYLLVVQTITDTSTCLIMRSEWSAIKDELRNFFKEDVSIVIMGLPSWPLHRQTKSQNQPDLPFVVDCPACDNSYLNIDLNREDFLQAMLGNKVFMDLAFFTHQEEKELLSHYETYKDLFPKQELWSECRLLGLKGWFKGHVTLEEKPQLNNNNAKATT